jgi:hypothetical protein
VLLIDYTVLNPRCALNDLRHPLEQKAAGSIPHYVKSSRGGPLLSPPENAVQSAR